jgi:hypothetical protein
MITIITTTNKYTGPIVIIRLSFRLPARLDSAAGYAANAPTPG